MAVERGLFYQALNAVLEVLLHDDLELDDYVVSFRRMYFRGQTTIKYCA